MALSPLQLVIDDELMTIARRWGRGIEVNENTLALDAIDRVGPRGSFLDDDHTLDNLRTGELVPLPLAERESRQVWEATGQKTVESKARERARALLVEHQPSPLADDVQRELDAIVTRADAAVD